MKKKIIAILSVLMVAFSMTACGFTDMGDLGLGTNSDVTGDTERYTYTAFTPTEEMLIYKSVNGAKIPFLPNNEYYLEEYDEVTSTHHKYGMHFYTYGNTQAEFDGYKAQFSGYEIQGNYQDGNGNTWYWFENEQGWSIEMTYYVNQDGKSVVSIHIYFLDILAEDGNNFTAREKALFNEYFGFVIPFLESEEYYVEEYSYYCQEDDETELGLNFYTYGNTKAEFEAYKALFTEASGYSYDGTEKDEYGDSWYYYSKGEYFIDFSYYSDGEGGYVMDLYIYELVAGDQTGENGGSADDVDLITNAGKGLPSDADGVYDVDFTKATYVKNVTEQGYYLDGCPTKGKPQVLVIPVEFSDVTAASKGYSIDKIKTAFNGGEGTTDYFSVHDYYYQSSYGQLDVQFTVLDSWFKPKEKSTYYEKAMIDYYGEETEGGDQLVLDEALQFLESKMDLSKFDSDGNTVIDAVILVTTLEINSEVNFYWAYRYWNIYTDGEGYYYEYDGVSANDYMWVPYQFLYEAYDEEGYAFYDDSVMNTYTFIHEFGHVLGADDYYDYAGVNEPMGGSDIMDIMTGDHNAFTKFNYGWITSSRLVVAEDSVTLTLEAFSKNGDTIIIANNWDETLGAYQEYYILAYYTNTGLNAEENGGGYFSRDGVVVYHINASLYKEVQGDTTYYDIYNNNTDGSDEYGTQDNLIEYVKSANDTFTYIAGDRMPTNLKDDQGNGMAYNFVVDSVTADKVTITFTKNK